MIIIVKNIIDFVEYIKIVIGAIFCQVIIIIELSQVNPSIISGNQKWNGAAPIFVKIAVSINIEEHFLDVTISLLDSIMIIANMKMVEAMACVTKYFIAASDSILFFVFLSKGIIESKLISNPAHILIQEFDEITISVLAIINVYNIILYRFFIKKGRDCYKNGV